MTTSRDSCNAFSSLSSLTLGPSSIFDIGPSSTQLTVEPVDSGGPIAWPLPKRTHCAVFCLAKNAAGEARWT